MPTVRVAPTSPLLQRTCLRCGYRGSELQRSGERTSYRCPGCGQDLYARPPRSYAEMEGIPVQVVTVKPAGEPVTGRVKKRRTLLGRAVEMVCGVWMRLTGRGAARVGAKGRASGRAERVRADAARGEGADRRRR